MCSPSSGMIARGSGDHHPMGPSRCTGIGNMPRRYAATSVEGSRSAPIPTMPCSSAVAGDGNSHFDGPTSCGSRLLPVVVEAEFRLPTEMTGGHHPPKGGDGRIVRITKLVVQRVEDGERRVEPDEVEQRQRPHREVAAALHGGIDVVATGGGGPVQGRRPVL